MIDQALSTLSGLTDLDRTAILQILMGQDDRTLKIKALLGITGDSKDHIIQFVVETVEDMVCRISIRMPCRPSWNGF